MTEQQIRAIVRDELEREAHRQGGIYDHCREAAFGMVRGVIEFQLKAALKCFGDDDPGLQ